MQCAPSQNGVKQAAACCIVIEVRGQGRWCGCTNSIRFSLRRTGAVGQSARKPVAGLDIRKGMFYICSIRLSTRRAGPMGAAAEGRSVGRAIFDIVYRVEPAPPRRILVAVSTAARPKGGRGASALTQNTIGLNFEFSSLTPFRQVDVHGASYPADVPAGHGVDRSDL